MGVPLRTRVLLADDHRMVRHGLRMLLDAEPDLEVVAEAGDAEETVRLALEHAVDLVVLDVAMPGRSGLDAARELVARRPDVRVLMLSMHDSEQYLIEALEAGASGYVLKTVADRKLVAACRAVMRGEPFLRSPDAAALRREALDAPAPRAPLSPREEEITRLVADSCTSEEIAARLGISPRTVERHRENIHAKLGMHDRVALTRWAIRHGLVDP